MGTKVNLALGYSTNVVFAEQRICKASTVRLATRTVVVFSDACSYRGCPTKLRRNLNMVVKNQRIVHKNKISQEKPYWNCNMNTKRITAGKNAELVN